MGAALIGVQVPSFVEQYGQRLQSHALESDTSLGEFQADADRYFKGDIEKLIAHYKNSKDSVFVDGSKSIEAISSRNKLLVRSLAQFKASPVSAYQATFIMPVDDIREEAWAHYDHSIRLKPISIIWALSFGALVAMLCELTIKLALLLLGLCGKLLFRGKEPTRQRISSKKAPPTL